MIFKNLIKYKLKKRMDLVYLDKPQGYITKDISPSMRRKKFLERYGKDFTYYSVKNLMTATNSSMIMLQLFLQDLHWATKLCIWKEMHFFQSSKISL